MQLLGDPATKKITKEEPAGWTKAPKERVKCSGKC
jgi:hypothetical protein